MLLWCRRCWQRLWTRFPWPPLDKRGRHRRSCSLHCRPVAAHGPRHAHQAAGDHHRPGLCVRLASFPRVCCSWADASSLFGHVHARAELVRGAHVGLCLRHCPRFPRRRLFAAAFPSLCGADGAVGTQPPSSSVARKPLSIPDSGSRRTVSLLLVRVWMLMRCARADCSPCRRPSLC